MAGSKCRQGLAQRLQRGLLLAMLGTREQAEIVGVERHGAIFQRTAAEQLADEAAAAVADQMQDGAVRQQGERFAGVVDRAAGERVVVERQDPVGIGGLQPSPLRGLGGQLAERALGVGEGPVQEQQPGLLGGRQPLLDRGRERAVPAHQAGLGHLPPVDALGHGSGGLAGEVDPDHPQALDRPFGDAARAVADGEGGGQRHRAGQDSGTARGRRQQLRRLPGGQVELARRPRA